MSGPQPTGRCGPAGFPGRLLHHLRVDRARAVNVARQQGAVADQVDQPRDAAREPMNGGQGRRGQRGLGGERQREIAYRFGVNLVMHVLTGNYKSDQVHVPALLERLGQ